MAERLRDRVYLAHAFHDVALNSLNRADFGRSKEYFHRFLDLVPDAFGATDMRLMAVAYELDDFEEAHRYVNRIVADFGDEKPGPWPMGSLGAYTLRADDPWLLEITVTLSKRGYEMNSKSPEIHDAVRRAETGIALASKNEKDAAELYRSFPRQLRHDILGRQAEALLAHTGGFTDEAIEIYSTDQSRLDRSGRTLFANWNLFWCAEAHFERGASGDVERAAGLLKEAISRAESCGMALLARRSRELLERSDPDAQKPAKTTPPAGLTDREAEVLGLVAQGLTNKVIGEKLFISVKTVNTHVSNIFEKIGVSNRSEATAYAIRSGHRD